MQTAFEFEVQFGKDGGCTKKRLAVGGIVVWGLVVLVLCLTGHAFLSLPASAGSFWRLLLRR